MWKLVTLNCLWHRKHWCAWDKIHAQIKKADNGSRTRLFGLGSQRSTDEPYLHELIIALCD